MNIWEILELQPTTDIKQIKLAYSIQLKKYKPETHPEQFKKIRTAYELAQKYSAGLSINDDLNNGQIIQQEDRLDINPEKLAYQLLDILIADQDNAITFLQDLQKNGSLDNFEFADHFQKVLAVNLLTAMPKYFRFICQLVDFFDWQEKVKNKTNDFYYDTAVQSLVNQTLPYRFMTYMHYLANIQSKKLAIEKKLDWNECRAAKILMSERNIPKFYLLAIFRYQIKIAIRSHLHKVKKLHPEALGLGFDILSVVWWLEYETRGIRARFETFFLMCSFAIIFLGIFGSGFISYFSGVDHVDILLLSIYAALILFLWAMFGSVLINRRNKRLFN